MNAKITVPQGSTGEVLHDKREKREVNDSGRVFRQYWAE